MLKNGKKDFKKWIVLKEKLHYGKRIRSIKEGDIWWCGIGENVGVEICGKGKSFARPVLVVRKYGTYSFLGVPLTSKEKFGSWYARFVFKGKKETAVLSQAEAVSVYRLYERIGTVPESDLELIRMKLCDLICDKKYPSTLTSQGLAGIPENISLL